MKELTGIGIPCIFYEVTGLRCSGCGNTHAVMGYMHFRWKEAFSDNYLFPAEFLFLSYVAVKSAMHYLRTGEKKLLAPPECINMLFFNRLCIWFLVRNLLHI